MGGGAGISLPGTFRAATDNTVFATPEAQVGFHPDAGASYYLSQLPGYLGENLSGEEMIACGLATHFTLNARLPCCVAWVRDGVSGLDTGTTIWTRRDLRIRVCFACVRVSVPVSAGHGYAIQRKLGRTHATELPWVEERLRKMITDDPFVIGSSLAQYVDLVYPDKGSVLHRIEKIDKCFGQDTVEEIIDALENEAATNYDEWCTLALKKLKEASPLSLKVSLRSIREGRFQADFNRLINASAESIVCPFVTLPNMSLMISVRLCGPLDQYFCRPIHTHPLGVRARLVDKDYAPKWDPPCLDQVSKDMLDFYFEPFNELEPELELPTAVREPFI